MFPDWKLKKIYQRPSTHHNAPWKWRGCSLKCRYYDVYIMLFFLKSNQHLHSLQCLSVQRSVFPVGPLGPACICVSLQHHHPPLPSLHWPQQPVLPAPRGDATRDAGAQWHWACYGRGNALQQLLMLYLSIFLESLHSVTRNSTSQDKEGHDGCRGHACAPPPMAQLLKNTRYSALLGAKMCDKVPSWELKHVIKCTPLGSKRALKCLLGAKTRDKVPSWEPKHVIKCPPGGQNVH